jgi:hypothetical protein
MVAVGHAAMGVTEKVTVKQKKKPSGKTDGFIEVRDDIGDIVNHHAAACSFRASVY